jgi:hypothetical protein
MKPGIFDRPQDPTPRRGEPSSRNEPESGTLRDDGFVGVTEEELEFFDTVGVESPNAADAFSFAGVRVRH